VVFAELARQDAKSSKIFNPSLDWFADPQVPVVHFSKPSGQATQREAFLGVEKIRQPHPVL
jgi:hypothetical protein